jgi:hypothetical protein
MTKIHTQVTNPMLGQQRASTVQPSEEQLLGEIETHLVGFRRRRRKKAAKPALAVRREPDHARDRWAIRVESDGLGLSGYLPRELASWLAPLLDDGALRIEGSLPTARRGWSYAAKAHPVVLTVFVREKGRPWLRETQVHRPQEALHEVVRRAYEEAHRQTDPALVRGLAEGLQRLEQGPLLPQTRLLLALLPGLAREIEAGLAVRAMAAFRSLLAQVTIGPPACHPQLTLFPLSWPVSYEPPYMLLSEAIEQGLAAVEEITEDGSVPNLRVHNQCDKPLLIPEGEILVGAKQNRVVNATVLVAACSTFVLPVSCVEQGRWGYQSRQLRTAFCAPPSLRSRKLRSVQANREQHGTAESNQGEVWAEVAKGLGDLGVHSPTASLADGLVSNEARLRACRQDVCLPEETAGILVARGERVIGLDLFDSPRTFELLWNRIADAYFFDALRNGQAAAPTPRHVPERFVDRIAGQARRRTPALGLGEELEISGSGVVGASLLYADRLCHLAAFTEVL